MYFIAIDLGATYIKSCRIRSQDFQLEGIRRDPFPAFARSEKPYERVVSAEAILAAVKEVLTAQLGVGGRCQGILFSNQMHGLVLLNAEGRAVTPFISWQDQRSVLVSERGISAMEWIKDTTRGFSWTRETGEFLREGFPLTQLVSMKMAGKDLRGLAPVDLGTFVISQLLHDGGPEMDLSNAAATGLFSLRSSAWHRDLLRLLQLDDLKMPNVVEMGSIAGVLRWDSQEIPVSHAVGDQQISILGAGLDRLDQLSVNIATGSQVSCLVDHCEDGEFQTRPFFGNQFLRTITHIPAGRSLNALVRLLSEMNPAISIDEAWERATALIGSRTKGTLKIDLSFFPSAFGSHGSIGEITESELTVGNLMASALDRLADSHWQAWKRMKTDSRPSVSELLGSGGLLKKSDYLQQSLRKCFALDLQISAALEDALEGHAVSLRRKS